MKKQEDRILKLLQENEYMHPTAIVAQTNVLQYNARISGLRKRFGCICKNGNTTCPADEHIRNKRLGGGATVFKYSRSRSKMEEFLAYREVKRAERKAEELKGTLFEL